MEQIDEGLSNAYTQLRELLGTFRSASAMPTWVKPSGHARAANPRRTPTSGSSTD
jgi:hypothetical protein